MTFVFDFGGVLADIDVKGFMERFTALMPSGRTSGFTPDELLGGGGNSFLHDYELGLIDSKQALAHFHALCRPEISDDDIRDVWNSELSAVPESTKGLLRQLKSEGHNVFLLSNTNAMHWETYIYSMFCEGGYTINHYFNHIFLSYKLHLFKPQPEMYAEIEKWIPTDDEVYYIDDVEINRLAAPRTWHTFASIEEMKNKLQL